MTGRRLKPGDPFPALRLRTIRQANVSIPTVGARWTHVQFRRFAGCPICNLHMRSFAERAPELAARGIREVAVFHSSEEAMLPYQGDLPFDVVADPEKKLYALLGVGASIRSVLSLGALASALRGSLATKPTALAENGRLGLPADFLVGPEGRVAACRYGVTADDHWTVDDLLALAV
ncbi:MAG: AhpC/TSA family protein [Elusimicrobia bacterium]|nr:AhpC/TSA family protein [Elusimicrobiota bacterium]